MIRFLVCISLCSVFGCSAVGHVPQHISPEKNIIVHSSVLAQGGSVLIVPFSAGQGVFASEELNRSALIIVRGIKDGLTENTGRFQVQSEAADQPPDLLVTGRIERLETQGSLWRYIGGRRYRVIKVIGKVVDKQGVMVAMFQRTLKKSYGEMSEIDFLLQVGKEIGAFLQCN